MEADGYRSYVIRIWSRRRACPPVVRLAIEEVRTGRRVELAGGLASGIDASISDAFASTERTGHASDGDPDPSRP